MTTFCPELDPRNTFSGNRSSSLLSLALQRMVSPDNDLFKELSGRERDIVTHFMGATGRILANYLLPRKIFPRFEPVYDLLEGPFAFGRVQFYSGISRYVWNQDPRFGRLVSWGSEFEHEPYEMKIDSIAALIGENLGGQSTEVFRTYI